MPRSPRLDLPGVQHHVMNRGARQAPIFLDDGDCAAFLDLLGELPLRFGVEVHAWALMPNHFHLLLVCPRAGLGLAMQYLQSRYARHLNRRYRWDGPVFRARYKNRVVEDDAYWAHLFAYVHLNPLRAGLITATDQPGWTSHRAYLGLDRRPEWLTTSALGTVFQDGATYAAYVEEVRVGSEPGPEGFDPAQLWGAPTAQTPPAPKAATTRWPWSHRAAWLAIQSVTGLSREALLDAPAGRHGGNPARDVAFWWLPRALGMSQSALARELKLSPSVFSRAGRRARTYEREGAREAAWMGRLQALLPS